MAHPVHDILRRFLGTEQFAFGAAGPQIWPWESAGTPGPDPDETDDEEPTQFDDIYPWLEAGN